MRVQPEGVDAAPELVTAPQDALQEVLEAPRKLPRPPSAPILAKEIIDTLISRYDFTPSDWRMILTVLAYIQRLGRYWSLQTRKQ